MEWDCCDRFQAQCPYQRFKTRNSVSNTAESVSKNQKAQDDMFKLSCCRILKQHLHGFFQWKLAIQFPVCKWRAILFCACNFFSVMKSINILSLDSTEQNFFKFCMKNIFLAWVILHRSEEYMSVWLGKSTSVTSLFIIKISSSTWRISPQKELILI